MKTLFSIFAVVVAAAMVSCGNANQPAVEAVDSTEVIVACDSVCADSAEVVVEEAAVAVEKK